MFHIINLVVNYICINVVASLYHGCARRGLVVDGGAARKWETVYLTHIDPLDPIDRCTHSFHPALLLLLFFLSLISLHLVFSSLIPANVRFSGMFPSKINITSIIRFYVISLLKMAMMQRNVKSVTLSLLLLLLKSVCACWYWSFKRCKLQGVASSSKKILLHQIISLKTLIQSPLWNQHNKWPQHLNDSEPANFHGPFTVHRYHSLISAFMRTWI